MSACALLGATCQGSGPHQADLSDRLSDLSEPARQAVLGAAGSLMCQEHRGRVLRDCLALHPECTRATHELELLKAMARSGATADELLSEAAIYYQSLESPPVAIDLAQAPCRGPEKALVTVAIFSDFECPACSGVRPLLESLAPEGGPVRVCFKYFPLDSHAFSRPTAQAAELARRQGKFWPLHDLLFDHQGELSFDTIVSLAARAGLDAAEVRRTLNQNAFLDLVNGSKAEGKALGVTGTPTLFLNGRLFTLPLDGPYLSRAVEDHVELAQGAGSAARP